MTDYKRSRADWPSYELIFNLTAILTMEASLQTQEPNSGECDFIFVTVFLVRDIMWMNVTEIVTNDPEYSQMSHCHRVRKLSDGKSRALGWTPA